MLFHAIREKSKIWLLLLLLQGVYVINFIHRQLPAVLAPQLQSHFELSKTELGLLYGTFFSFFYAMTGLFTGMWSAGRSFRWLVSGSIVLWSFFTVLHGLATSSPVLFLLRILVAVAQSAITPIIYALLAERFLPNQRGFAVSWYASGIFIGIAASYLGGGTWVLAHSWQDVFIVSGAAGMVLGVLVYFVLPDSKSAGNRNISFKTLRIYVADPALRNHLLGFSMLSFTGYAMLGFAASFFRATAGAEAVPMIGWFVAGNVVSVPVAGVLTDYLGRRSDSRRFLVPVMTSIIGLLFYSVAFSGLFSSTILAGFGVGLIITSSYNGIAPALLQNRLSPEHRIQGGAVYLLVINVVGLGIGPLVTGVLADWTGNLSSAMWTTAVIGNGLAVFFLLKAKKHWN